jgi:hypothetical protein
MRESLCFLVATVLFFLPLAATHAAGAADGKDTGGKDTVNFQGNVKAVRTDVLVDKAAEELYPKWRDNFEQWQKTGSDFGYHYMGSAIWFNRIGRAMGEAMLELLGGDQ